MVSVLLLLDIYWNKTIFTIKIRTLEYRIVRMLGYGLMVTGMLLYPLVEISLGMIWPNMVLFGAECPTTIFLIGLLISATPQTNKLFIAILAVNAIYTGGSFALMGFPVDFLYAFSGIIGLIVIITYWKQIKFLPLKTNS